MTSTEVPHGPGSLASAPLLPEGLAETFRDRYATAGGLRTHYLTGGDGPPLLVLGGAGRRTGTSGASSCRSSPSGSPSWWWTRAA